MTNQCGNSNNGMALPRCRWWMSPPRSAYTRWPPTAITHNG